jgi:hypothetical protein
VEWETTGFAEGLTEFSIHAVNASDNSYFDTLYVRTADRKIVDWYWREYTGGAPALTHTLDEAPTGKSSTLRAVFPAAVLDHLGPGFGWEAAVRHDQGGHDSCPSGDGNLIFDDEE